ncbi:MAG: NTP transferase domain-containing protein, partial [Cephaloticoccus sp.]|nr:NTP transferase domain-containing protein [Cephaloticoccus sp.]
RTGVAKIQLSVRPEQNWVPAGIPVVHDAQVDAGPLAGLAAAMAAMTSTHLLVLAVDLPHMEGAWFSGLMKLCSPGVGAVGRHEGYFEPLAAIYPRELLVAAEATLAGGDRSLQRFIVGAGDAMRHHEITSAEAPWFANWNEPVN